MKFKKIESTPETTTFGLLPIGTTFNFGDGAVCYKTHFAMHFGSVFNTLRLCDAKFLFIQDAELVQVLECVLEYKVVR